MPTPLTVLGIDPGLSGGLAAIRGGSLILGEPLPTWEVRDGERRRRCIDGAELARVVADLAPDCCYLENCYGRRNDRAGPQSAFGFGGAWWVVMDRLREYGAPVYAIQPRTWQRQLLRLRGRFNREDTKSASIAIAKQLFPDIDLTPGRCTNPQDGISDAALIAYFGYLEQSGPAAPKPAQRKPGRRRGRRGVA